MQSAVLLLSPNYAKKGTVIWTFQLILRIFWNLAECKCMKPYKWNDLFMNNTIKKGKRFINLRIYRTDFWRISNISMSRPSTIQNAHNTT